MLTTTLIVTERQEFYGICERIFEAQRVKVKHSSYKEADLQQKLDELQPDAVLMDVSLNEKAMSALNIVQACPLAMPPAVFLRLSERTPNWEKTFLAQGVMYVFDGGMSEQMMIDSLLNVYAVHRGQHDEVEIEQQIKKILRICCISVKHRGYGCIMDGMRMIYRQPDMGKALTKRVYPSIANNQHTTPTRVEKNIRDAINTAWANNGSEIMPDFLGCSAQRPPSNGQFIMAAGEKLREALQRREHHVEAEPVGV